MRSKPTHSDDKGLRVAFQTGTGQRLRAARCRRGLTVPELARKAGVSPELIATTETGEPIPLWKLFQLSEALEVTMDSLVKDGAP